MRAPASANGRDPSRLRREIVQQLHALGAEHRRHERYARDIGAGTIETCPQLEANRIATDRREHDGNRRARLPRGACRDDVTGGGDGDDALRDQFGREPGERPVVAIRPTLLDADVAALDEARLCESLPERIGIEPIRRGRRCSGSRRAAH